MDVNSVQKGKQWIALIAGLAIMYVSFNFSVRGFGFEIQDKSLEWMGMTLAAVITACELVFNGQLAYNQRNASIYMLGVASYGYGIFSNIVGVWAAQGLNGVAWGDLTISHWFGVFIALFIELAAEPLIIYGLIGISEKEGDFIGALFKTFSTRRSGQSTPAPRIQTPQKPASENTFRGNRPQPAVQSKPNSTPHRVVGTLRADSKPAPTRPSFKPDNYDEKEYSYLGETDA